MRCQPINTEHSCNIKRSEAKILSVKIKSSVTIQIKAIQRYLSVMLFLMLQGDSNV